MVYRLGGLRHHPVIRRHDQHYDVGYFRAPCAHRGKRLVTRSVEERDHSLWRIDVVGADVLRDAAGFAAGNPCASNIVEKRGLAMVDMAHHRHNWRARLQPDLARHRLLLGQKRVGIIEFRALGNVPHLLHQNHGGILVEHLINGHHAAHLHEGLDDFGRLHRHLMSKVPNRNGFRNRDLAYDRLGRRTERMLRLALLPMRGVPRLPPAPAQPT